jgi:ketosteroid isomerase-like protein
MLDKNKQTARRFVLGIGESKLPDELFAKDFAGWSGLSGDIDGPVFRERALMLGEVFPEGLTFEIFETIAEGSNVALRCASTGTVFDGTPYRNDYHYLFTFDDAGRIRHVREYMNVQVAAEIIRPAFAQLMRRKAKPVA